MASEIRVLEDQLYDADYQNRVLRDKVEQLQRKQQEDYLRLYTPSPQPDPPADVPAAEPLQMGEGLGNIDDGEVAELPPPAEADTGDTDSKVEPLAPPPGGPEPPGADDLELPEVFPGEPVPPPTAGESDDQPQGQIELPSSVQVKAVPSPAAIRLHRGLSGGHQFEDDTEGLFLVVNAVDQQGRIVDLDEFDVDAELTVVALDPDLDPSHARIGRWEFAPERVKQLIRGNPTSGLQIPVRWQESEPAGEEVIVHVRLKADDEVMRCEGRIRVNAAAAVAGWTPRGGSSTE